MSESGGRDPPRSIHHPHHQREVATAPRRRHAHVERGREDDHLPYDLPDFEAALDEYYAARDWNEDGTVPDEATNAASSVAGD